MIYYILEQSKETILKILQFSKGTTKDLWKVWMVEYSKRKINRYTTEKTEKCCQK